MDIPSSVATYFAQQGVLGIIVLMLIGVVVWQQKRIDNKDKQITELQDKRKADTDGYTASYTATIRDMIIASKDSLNAANLLQRSVDSLAAALQSLMSNKK